MKKADIVLFGEHHNNPIIHWLQYETVSELHNSISLTLGAEMIETDNQNQLNKYLSGNITPIQLDTTARLWKNYDSDYRPLVDFAKKNGLKFIATNIPRMYATKVYRSGFEVLENLSDSEKLWMAPLPIKYDANSLVHIQDIYK